MVNIHLKITIEGDLFQKTFEADPNLKYTYAWRGVNVYRQRVYGTTTALVKVGVSVYKQLVYGCTPSSR